MVDRLLKDYTQSANNRILKAKNFLGNFAASASVKIDVNKLLNNASINQTVLSPNDQIVFLGRELHDRFNSPSIFSSSNTTKSCKKRKAWYDPKTILKTTKKLLRLVLPVSFVKTLF